MASASSTVPALARVRMRAAVYDHAAPEGVKVVQRAAPSSPPPRGNGNEVLVRVRACGVNPVDAKEVVGDKLPGFLRPIARRLVTNGKTCGFDLSGVVESAPAGSTFRPGDEVFGAVPPLRGSFCELARVPSNQLCRKPSALTHAEAAALVLPGLTVVQLLSQHGFEPGQRVLVIGASGGVGHVAVKVLRAFGAGSVTGICGERNVAFVRSLGADDVVAYDSRDNPNPSGVYPKGGGLGSRDGDGRDRVMDALAAIVEKNGAPFDVVVDAVSSGDAVDAAHAYERRVLTHDNPPLLATGANSDPHNYVTIGAKFSGWVKAGLKRVAGVNAFPPRRELFWITFPNCANDLETLRALADEKGLRPSIETVVPLTDDGVREAFRRLKSRRTRGKIAIEV